MPKSYPKLRPTVFDALVVLLVILLAVGTSAWFYGGLAGKGEDVTAVILHHGQEVERVRLSGLAEEKTIAIAGDYHLTITLSPDGAQVISSDCPTQDCVRTGHVGRVGQSIICLPEQVVVKLEGRGSGSEPDLILG